MTLRNGQTVAVPYPKAGFNCSPDWSLAQGVFKDTGDNTPLVNQGNNPTPRPWKNQGLLNCPHSYEGRILPNGQPAVAFPEPGYNCTRVQSQAFAEVEETGVPTPFPWGFKGLQNCPHPYEGRVLPNGRPAVAFPEPGFNCTRVQSSL